MPAIIFDGKTFAQEKLAKIKETVSVLRFTPRMGSVVFIDDEASLLYTRLKKQAAVEVGIEFSEQEVFTTEQIPVLQEKIKIYCDRPDIHGVLIQKPMKNTWKQQFDKQENQPNFESWWDQIVLGLDSNQDIDCLTQENLDKVYKGTWSILPATVKAVVSILAHTHDKLGFFRNGDGEFDLAGFKAVVVGRSDIVGKPLAAVLQQYGAEVSLFGSDLKLGVIQQADIVVSATGSPEIITGDMIKPNAVVIDVGSPKGDVNFDEVKEKASFITPVPGGVGPVTVASLMENLLTVVANRSR